MSSYYDAEIGRFTSKDRFMGFENRPASQNRYTYCENDPVNAVDPSGYVSWSAIKAFIREYWGGLLNTAAWIISAFVGGGPITGVFTTIAAVLYWVEVYKGERRFRYLTLNLRLGASVVFGSLSNGISKLANLGIRGPHIVDTLIHMAHSGGRNALINYLINKALR